MKRIKLNKSEIQSHLLRTDWAEGLILQLPKDHEGRNSWLLNYVKKEEFINHLIEKKIAFDEKDDQIIIKGNNAGWVSLDLLNELPENIVFNNGGSIWLKSITKLPENIQFNNKKDMYLNKKYFEFLSSAFIT